MQKNTLFGRQKLLWGIGVVFLVSAVSVYSAPSASFLRLGGGARPAGLGNAYVGLADGVHSLYWNPGGLGLVARRQLMGTYLQWFEDTTGMYVGYVHPLQIGGSVGVGITHLTIGDIRRYEEGVDRGTINFSNLAIGVSYGRELRENIHLGGTIKKISETIDQTTGSSFAIDVGGLYRIPDRKLSLGAAIQNLGPGMTFLEESEPLPLTIRVGGAYLLSDEITFVAETNKVTDADIDFRVGAEYLYRKQFALRAGYATGPADGGGISFGLGLKQKMFTIDYAYVPVVGLGTHRITLSIAFP